MAAFLPLLALAAGGAIAAMVMRSFYRHAGDAEIARATAEAEARARRDEGQLRASLEGARVEVSASERRASDLRAQLESAVAVLGRRDEELRLAHQEITRHRTEEATYATRLDELTKAQASLKEAFQSLCGEALRTNNEQFLQLARTELERVRAAAHGDLQEREAAIESLVAPIRDGLSKYDEKLQQIEKERTSSFAALAQRIDLVAVANESLRRETAGLTRALTSSNVRGAWGELQLRRVVELAGMLEHCDFDTQQTVDGDAGKLRPDMIVHLPGDRLIVVDAKTPATAVLEAVNSEDAAKREHACAELVTQLRKHVDALSKKAYWDQFPTAPDFVVLFLPSEAFYCVALQHDPGFFERAFQSKVFLATPTTLIAVLKAVYYGWRHDAIEKSAQEISELGRELYDRIRILGEHFESVGVHLGKSVSAYNEAVGSLERRVLPSARRFKDFGAAGSKEIAELASIERAPVALNAAELRLSSALPASTPVT